MQIMNRLGSRPVVYNGFGCRRGPTVVRANEGKAAGANQLADISKASVSIFSPPQQLAAFPSVPEVHAVVSLSEILAIISTWKNGAELAKFYKEYNKAEFVWVYFCPKSISGRLSTGRASRAELKQKRTLDGLVKYLLELLNQENADPTVWYSPEVLDNVCKESRKIQKMVVVHENNLDTAMVDAECFILDEL